MLGVLKALLVQELLKLNREFQKFLRELSDIFYKNFLRTSNWRVVCTRLVAQGVLGGERCANSERVQG